MKLRSYGLVTISLLILLGSCLTAAATSISDGTNDIWHWQQSAQGATWSWQGNVGNKPNIDITEISYSVDNGKITLKMEVAGSIQTSDKVGYYVWYNTTDTVYMLSYMNGEGTGWGMKGSNMTFEQNVTVSGDTLSVVLDAIGNTSKVELWGWAVEYTTALGDVTNEWWGDWAPNDKFGYDTGDDGTDDDDGTDGTDDGSDTDGSGSETNTPGFELLFVVAAVAVALILLRKRR